MSHLERCSRCGEIGFLELDEFDFGIEVHKCKEGKRNNITQA